MSKRRRDPLDELLDHDSGDVADVLEELSEETTDD